MNLESTVLQVHVEDIIPNRFQPRLSFDEEGLKELADSIKEHGIIQPLVLRKLGDKYEIIAGERRYKAAQMAGLTTVPAVIANIDDKKSAEVALVENVQRRDLTAIEEARSYKTLLDKGYLTQDQLAKRMGLSQPAVANKLRLLNLDDEVQQALLDEKISERHARTLLSLPDKAAQREWLHRIINERLTVRQLDLEIKKYKESQGMDMNDTVSEEVPLVEQPSLESIKENAIDLNEFNRFGDTPAATAQNSVPNNTQNSFTPVQNNFEPVQNNFEPVQNNFDNNSFTTATKIPEFNIATPNSASTFVPNIPKNGNNESKFFDFNDDSGEDSGTSPSPIGSIGNNTTIVPINNFGDNSPISNQQQGGFEQNSAPETNNFEVFSAPTGEEKPVEEKPQIQPVTPSPMDDQPATFLSPNNKFFTPISETPADITIETKQNEIVDPMDKVNKLTPEYKEEVKETKAMELKDAISKIRSCIEDLGNQGFFIEVEEIDFDTNYQITMRIDKGN